jgi:phenylalanyl-tRNA synthetase beta chain
MRVPLAWLRDYVELPTDVDAIVTKLAALGFPVDEIETRPTLTNVVVGVLTAVTPHPNADRLQLCTVDVGAEAPLTIATAATNVAKGQTVPVARIGAKLAGGLEIAPRKMRGIDSEGMLCSADELGFPSEWFEDGILQLDAGLAPGTDAIAYFRLSEPVLEVEVTTNRPDALSIVGLARELAAAFGKRLREPQSGVGYADGPEDIRVTIETVDCKRFVFQRVSGLRVRPAKAWMRLRLALAGQRPINNVVDISNFAMLELGQPLHFFDHARIAGGHLIVRDANEGETFTTLDDQVRTLDPREIVICDAEGPTSLAGIMGGLRSEVVATTTDVVIEAAAWTGPRIRRAAAALKMRTEASSRFEKSLPIALADVGAARAARLLEQEGASIHMPRAAGRPAPDPAPVTLPDGEVERLLGFTVSPEETERALTSLGCEVKRVEDGLRVQPPYWRGDLVIPADLVEEIARVVGYDHVEAVVPPVQQQEIDSAQFDRENQLAGLLEGLGYTEMLSLSLQPGSVAETWHQNGVAVPQPVEITNPLSEDQRWMRFSLAPALLGFAARDRAVRPYRVFELGHVFANQATTPEERIELTAVRAGDEGAFGALKSDVLALLRRTLGVEPRVEAGTYPSLHPGKTAALHVGDQVVGYVGVVDPRLAHVYEVAATTALATVFVDTLPARSVPVYTPPSKFPPLDRDLAVVVPLAVRAGDLVAAIREDPLVVDARPFDEYRGAQVGEGRKSVALRIVLQSREGTLTDEQADAAMSGVVALLRERFGAEPRT